MTVFLLGATAMGFLTAAVFFLKLWRGSGDRLFLFFAVAFAVLAGSRVLLAFAADPTESLPGVYGVRLVAFLCIIAGIVDKNIRSDQRRKA